MKKFMSTVNFSIIFSFLLLLASCSVPEDEELKINEVDASLELETTKAANNAAKAKMYTADLTMLNASGVKGTAELTLMGDELTVKISATGLEEGALHPQHIHGFAENNKNSKCPPASADNNGDGFVSVGEGVPFYGPILQPLVMDIQDPLSFPTAEDGTIEFSMTYTVDKSLLPLQNNVIVLHGMTVEGYVNADGETVNSYIATLPVACGQISPAQGANGKDK